MRLNRYIYALRHDFRIPLGPGRFLKRFVYSYLIEAGERVFLIDSGTAGAEEKIFSYLEEIGRSPDRIDTLFLTHAHPDHIGAAGVIRTVSGCRVAASGLEKRWIENVELQKKERPVPGFDSLVAGPVSVDHALYGGERFVIGEELALEVISTPGHSPGSLSFYLSPERALFSGDAVLMPGQLPVYTDAAAVIATIGKLQAFPEIELLLSSWDQPHRGVEVKEVLNKSRRYLFRIQAEVDRATVTMPSPEPMELCRRMVKALQLPPAAVNPLIARAFLSHLSGGIS